jgi:hypothetical protein
VQQAVSISRFDLNGVTFERLPPVRTSNGDCKAFVTARAPKKNTIVNS